MITVPPLADEFERPLVVTPNAGTWAASAPTLRSELEEDDDDLFGDDDADELDDDDDDLVADDDELEDDDDEFEAEPDV